MKLAIMQPYFFPYLGYWQLINAVDKYVVYDDVAYIKGGWINRNNILVNGNPTLITLPLEKSSSFKKINEISIVNNDIIIDKLLKTVFPLRKTVLVTAFWYCRNRSKCLLFGMLGNALCMVCHLSEQSEFSI